MSTPETPISGLPPSEPPTRFGSFREKRSPALFATLLVAFAIGGGVTAAALQARRHSLVMLTAAPITSMRGWSEVAVKGQVAEIFGNKFIVQDDSGRAPPPPLGGPEAGLDDMGAPPPPPPGGPGPRGQRPPPPPPSRAAHFRLQRGDAMVDAKCADEESMKACAELALQMVDRLQTIAKP